MIEKKVAAGNDPKLSSEKAKSARLVSFHFHFDRPIVWAPYSMGHTYI